MHEYIRMYRCPMDGHEVKCPLRLACRLCSISKQIHNIHVMHIHTCTHICARTGDLGMAINWSDNCYLHADFACSGSISYSSTVGNTACRAPGMAVDIFSNVSFIVILHCKLSSELTYENLREMWCGVVGSAASARAHTYTHSLIHSHTLSHTHAHAHTHTRAHTYAHTYTHTCIHTHTSHTHAYIHQIWCSQ